MFKIRFKIGLIDSDNLIFVLNFGTPRQFQLECSQISKLCKEILILKKLCLDVLTKIAFFDKKLIYFNKTFIFH